MKRIFKTLLAGIGLAALGQGAQAEPDPSLPTYEQAAADPDNWRAVDPENLIIFQVQAYDYSDKGSIYIETADFAAPKHVAQFKKVVRSGDFDGTIFHRVIDDFMAQGGDITTAGKEDNWPNIEQEFVFKRDPSKTKANLLGQPLSSRAGYIDGFPVGTQVESAAGIMADGKIESWIRHCPGVVSTARTDDPNSAGTQFFLMRYTADHLDKTYTAWARVVSGLDVVRDIKVGKGPNGGVRLVEADKLGKAVLAADLPKAERPRILVQRTDGPLFAKFLEEHANERDVCNLPPVPVIVAPRDN